MKNITTILIAASVLSASACAGRTAYWEDKGADAGGAAVQTDAAAVEPGDAAWAKRADANSVKEAIKHWEKAAGCSEGDSHPKKRCAKVPTDGSNSELLAKLTRAYYFLADGFMRANDEQYLDTMDRGVWWGERALATVSPEFKQAMADGAKFHEAVPKVGKEGVPAMYWYATCLGKWAKKKSFAVLVGQKDNVKATMEHVLALGGDEWSHGAAHRYFGAMYAIAPKFAGGDMEKSKTSFEKSIGIAPYYLSTKVLMAEHYMTKVDDEEGFKKLLNEVLAFDPKENEKHDLVPESLVEQQKAKELLDNIDEYF